MIMFYQHNNTGYRQMLNGVAIKTLVYGDKSLLTEFKMTGGSQLPSHAHPYEQTGYLVKGRIRLYIGDQVYEVEPGDSWCVPENVTHRADILEDSVAVEVF